MHQPSEVEQGSAQSIDFVDQNTIHAMRLYIIEETLQRGTVDIAARETTIVVGVRQRCPPEVALAPDVRLCRLALGLK